MVYSAFIGNPGSACCIEFFWIYQQQALLGFLQRFQTSTTAGLAQAIVNSQQKQTDGPIHIKSIGRGDEEQLLEQFQQLSDQEVDVLLRKAFTEEEKE